MINNYKRIAKNTVFLYFRMILIMGVSFYTIRVVLEALGAEDFGLFNVVGSIVLILSFFNTSLTLATQRYITFELGKRKNSNLRKVFSTSMIIHTLLALFLGIFLEVFGVWFLNNKLNIPIDRMDATFWVLQFAVLSIIINVIKVPYDALIIAHERMSFFAYVSILEALLKLSVVFLLLLISFDKLIIYAVLNFFVVLLIFLFYFYYIKKHYNDESKLFFIWDKKLIKEMISFSSWNVFGGVAWVLMNHGINIMLNIFFGPVVNASRSISMQVNMAIVSLINSFRTAINPQIIKMYSSNNIKGMKNLTLLGARYTFYLALILILPLYLEIETILELWLTEIPLWTVEFCKLILIFSLIQSFDLSFGIVFQAIGKVKENQLLSGGVYLFVLPVSYMIVYYLKLEPLIIYYIQITAAIIVSFVIKVYLLKKLAGISYKEYWSDFLFPIIKVLVVVVVGVYLLTCFHLQFIINLLACIILVSLTVLFIDISSEQREKLISLIKLKKGNK
ncbi:oligosaccharide flippase family protein [Arcobacter sp. YIC-464]|uniref:oligosaccharide flippase family protein n=1 Tax=Arcobacter sp. YIC-464 TaxID=3376631 RepID=UPI003C1AE586